MKQTEVEPTGKTPVSQVSFAGCASNFLVL